MCTRCGRPQAARKGPCMVCGEALPDAPVAGERPPEAPFLLIEGGGRTIAGIDRRLTYHADTSSPPIIVELGNLQGVALGRQLMLEALALVPLAIVLVWLFPFLRPVAAVLTGLGLLGAVMWRRYFLVLKPRDGGLLRWPLGVVRLGSDRARLIDASWTSGAQALASRGVTVREGPGTLGPGA